MRSLNGLECATVEKSKSVAFSVRSTLVRNMAEESRSDLLVEEPLLIEEPIQASSAPVEEQEIPADTNSKITALSFAAATSHDNHEHTNGDAKILVTEDEPEVSFEGQTEPKESAPPSWRDGMTPRAVQAEEAHAGMSLLTIASHVYQIPSVLVLLKMIEASNLSIFAFELFLLDPGHQELDIVGLCTSVDDHD